MERHIRQRVAIDEMQCRFMSVIKNESMDELLVKLDACQYWKEKGLYVNIRYEVIYSGFLSSSAPNICGTTL